MINKKGESKILLLFGIIIFYGFFSFLYIAMGNTFANVNSNNSSLPYVSTDSIHSPKILGSTSLPEETNGIGSIIIKGIDNAPDWLNWLFGVLTALTALLIIIILVHG